MKINGDDTNSFELYVMDLMDEYKKKLVTADDVFDFSEELHQSIEVAIQDMLEDGFNDIDPFDYTPYV